MHIVMFRWLRKFQRLKRSKKLWFWKLEMFRRSEMVQEICGY